MDNNAFDYSDDELEQAKKIIFDETNVTNSNPLSDLLQILIKIVAFILLIYFTMYFGFTVFIKTMSVDTQIKLENFLSQSNSFETVEIAQKDKERLINVKNNILAIDKEYPKTSNLNIYIIKEDYLNAFCAPNGNIYITQKLYNLLKQDGELMFILAHEMSHYRDKDHLLGLRTELAGKFVVIIMSALSNNQQNFSNIIAGAIDLSNLKYSRNIESKCDKYASNIVMRKYSTIKPATDALKLLKDDSPDMMIDAFSTHPNLDRRIKLIEQNQD